MTLLEKSGLRCRKCPTAQAGYGCRRLFFLDSFDGAVVGTGTAADADISIDDILLVALRDSFNGAVVGTGAALDASISDLESHDFSSICLLLGILIVMHFYSSMVF